MDSDDAPPADFMDTNHSEDDDHPNTDTVDNADSSSDSDSDSDSDDEAQQHLQIQALESQLSSNPSNYDAHVQYIKLLRKTGEIDKLRQARESMSQLFPLSPSIWQEWLKDEISLSSSRPEAVPSIEQLFERAVFDYLSVPVWCDYLSFVQENDPSVAGCSADGLSKARSLFERALTAAGLHFSEGSKVWNAYKEFEQAVLLTIDESDNELKEKQVQRIRTIFHRQLSVPLADMSSSLRAYKAWEFEQGNLHDPDSDDLGSLSSPIASAYKKALILHDDRVNMEEQISKAGVSDSERLSSFMTYLRFEDSSGDPARVHVLYERAITEFPVSSDLWLDYTHYLNKTLKVGNVVRDAHLRATKNCPWVGELWVRYLLSLERCHASEDERSTVFEKALLCTFSSYEEYLDLFLTRIDGLRRMMSAAEEIQMLDYAVIRDTFQRASDYLAPQLKGTEALVRLYAYWARLELSLRKDIAAARSVWESLLKISGLTLEAWKGYIAMEIENGNLNEARSIYRRCYTKKFPGSGSEDICHSWLRFEREFGTLEEFDQAIPKVSRRLDELQLFRQQQESKTVSASVEQRDNSSKQNTREKRKAGPSTDQHPVKRHKESKEISKKEVKMDSALGHKPVERNMEGIDAKIEPDGTNEHQKKEFSREKPKFTDQCTAFISNLNLDTNIDDLGNFFSDAGGVVGIRILKDKFTGKSRGLAYVDFSDEAHLNAALAKNKKTLMGKKLSIRKSDPTKGKRQESGKDGKAESSGEHKGSKMGYTKGAKVSKTGAPALGGGRRRGGESLQLEGKNTFAVPRAVKSVDTTKPPREEVEIPMPLNSAYPGAHAHVSNMFHQYHYHDHRHHHDEPSHTHPSSNGPVMPITLNNHHEKHRHQQVRYRECLKNHAASMGGNVTDGCGEFMPSGEESTIEAFICSVCNCHRNFHRKEVEGEPSTLLMINNKHKGGKVINLGHHHKNMNILSPAGINGVTATTNRSVPIIPYNMGSLLVYSDQSDGQDEGGGGGAVAASPGVAYMGFPPPPPPSSYHHNQILKKRFRTKFTPEQKEKMFNFAEKIGWTIQKQEESELQQFNNYI